MKDQWLLKNAFFFFFFYLLFLFFFSITVNYNSILNKLGTPKNDKAKTSKTTLWSQFPHLINSETTVAPPTQYEKGQWFSKIGEWKLNTERVKKKIKKKKKKTANTQTNLAIWLWACLDKLFQNVRFKNKRF